MTEHVLFTALVTTRKTNFWYVFRKYVFSVNIPYAMQFETKKYVNRLGIAQKMYKRSSLSTNSRPKHILLIFDKKIVNVLNGYT